MNLINPRSFMEKKAVCGNSIGKYAMVGEESVVAKGVENPAKS